MVKALISLEGFRVRELTDVPETVSAEKTVETKSSFHSLGLKSVNQTQKRRVHRALLFLDYFTSLIVSPYLRALKWQTTVSF